MAGERFDGQAAFIVGSWLFGRFGFVNEKITSPVFCGKSRLTRSCWRVAATTSGKRTLAIGQLESGLAAELLPEEAISESSWLRGRNQKWDWELLWAPTSIQHTSSSRLIPEGRFCSSTRNCCKLGKVTLRFCDLPPCLPTRRHCIEPRPFAQLATSMC